MKTKELKILSYIYLILPIIIFAIGWLKIFISIPVIAILLGILYIKIKKEKKDKIEFIKKRYVVILFFIILIICITAGQGNIFYQSNDWHWRNAIFRDLINIKWPVYYEKMDANLTYYIGFWMVPAVIGKVFLTFLGENTTWIIANLAALLWCTIGVLLTILWIFKILKIKTKKDAVLTLLIFFGFSGLDILGVILYKSTWVLNNLHIEWWTDSFQFSSIITQLFFVYNQCVASWLITMIFLDEKKCDNYLLLILLCLPYGPLPFVGLIPLFAMRGLKFLVRSIKVHRMKEFLKDVFSIQNILALISIFPIYYLYYTCNVATTTGGFRLDTSFLNVEGIRNLVLFFFLEVGIYAVFLMHENRTEELFWTALVELLLIPLFKIGNSIDFSMRVSIPPMIIIIFYLIRYIKNKKTEDIKATILIIVFLIGSITPIIEYTRAIYSIIKNDKINLVADDIKTFSDKQIDNFENFVGPNQSKFRYIKK